ncbi:probable G-protein coupled receptor 139 [Hemiscyllium ocellatum]|uniref:probable G-protein coupled receptor 139 n=1 Tax=Hemiscyllium ocellatum TaxID=170820 RepID=UPI002967773D|nr:probable G-protein coupled receptor 139 [Hemiscyllium ocellatum]
MAGADLLVVLIQVILDKLNRSYLHIVFFSNLPGCSIRDVIGSTAVSSSVWLTVTFTFDRMVAICFQKLKTKFCTERNAAVIITTVSLLSLFIKIPLYFKYETYYCKITYEYFYYLVWLAFDWGDRILTPVLPFFLILLLNAVTVRHILLASAVRRKLRGQPNGDKPNDPEMKNQRRSIILLFAISGSFILLWTTRVITLAIQRITGWYIGAPAGYWVGDHMGTMLQLSSSCTNTFIYTVTKRKFREEMLNTVKYPFITIQNSNKRWEQSWSM